MPRSPMAGLWRRTPGREAARASERAGGRTCFASSVRPSLPGLAGAAAARRSRWGALTGGRSPPLHSSASPARSLLPTRPFPPTRPQPSAHRDGGADGAALGARRPQPGWNPAAGTPRGRSIPGLHAAASAPPPGGRGRAGGAGAEAGRGRRGGRARRGGRTVRAGRAGQAAGRAGGGGRAPGSVTLLAAPPQTPQERSLRHPPSCFLVPGQSEERPSASSANQPPRPALAPPANPALGSPSQAPANQSRGSVVPTQGAARGGWGRRCGEWWGLGGGVRCPGWWRVVVFFPGFWYFFLRLQSLEPASHGDPTLKSQSPSCCPHPRNLVPALAVTPLHPSPPFSSLAPTGENCGRRNTPALASGCCPQGKASGKPDKNQSRTAPLSCRKGPRLQRKGPDRREAPPALASSFRLPCLPRLLSFQARSVLAP